MTREEQIKKQADIYTDDASNYTEWSDDWGWSATNDIELVEKAFIEGAKWADANPKSPWISVEDDLPCNHEELILTSVVTYLVPARLKSLEGNVSYVMCYMYRASKDNEWVWQFYKPGYRVTHWMQIPKLVEE